MQWPPLDAGGGFICVYDWRGPFVGGFDSLLFQPLNQIIVACDVDVKSNGGNLLPPESIAAMQALQKPGEYEIKFVRPINSSNVTHVCTYATPTQILHVTHLKIAAPKRCKGLAGLGSVQECAGVAIPDAATPKTNHVGRWDALSSHRMKLTWSPHPLLAYSTGKQSDGHDDSICVWGQSDHQAAGAPPQLLLHHLVKHAVRKGSYANDMAGQKKNKNTVRLQEGKNVLSTLYEKQEDGPMPVMKDGFIDRWQKQLNMAGQKQLNMADININILKALNAHNSTKSSLKLTIRYQRAFGDKSKEMGCSWEAKERTPEERFKPLETISVLISELQVDWCPVVDVELTCASSAEQPNGDSKKLCGQTFILYEKPYQPPKSSAQQNFVCAWEKGDAVDDCNYGQLRLNDHTSWLLRGIWRADRMPVHVHSRAGTTTPGNLLGGILKEMAKQSTAFNPLRKPHPCEVLMPDASAGGLETDNVIGSPIIISYEHHNSVSADRLLHPSGSKGL